MKRKISFLVLMALMVTALTACGGEKTDEPTNEVGGTELTMEVDTEKETQVEVSAKIDYTLEYIENGFCYVISDNNLWDKTYVDGNNLSNEGWQTDHQEFVLMGDVPLYAYTKEMAGYIKEGVHAYIYVSPNSEWCYLQYISDEVISHPGDFARLEDVSALVNAIGVGSIVDDEDTTMNENTTNYFAKLRNRIAEENANRAKMVEENGANLQQLVEVNSPEGLEKFGPILGYFNSEEDIDNIMSFVYNFDCNKYYIEYLEETDDYVKFNFYGAQ